MTGTTLYVQPDGGCAHAGWRIEARYDALLLFSAIHAPPRCVGLAHYSTGRHETVAGKRLNTAGRQFILPAGCITDWRTMGEATIRSVPISAHTDCLSIYTMRSTMVWANCIKR